MKLLSISISIILLISTNGSADEKDDAEAKAILKSFSAATNNQEKIHFALKIYSWFLSPAEIDQIGSNVPQDLKKDLDGWREFIKTLFKEVEAFENSLAPEENESLVKMAPEHPDFYLKRFHSVFRNLPPIKECKPDKQMLEAIDDKFARAPQILMYTAMRNATYKGSALENQLGELKRIIQSKPTSTEIKSRLVSFYFESVKRHKELLANRKEGQINLDKMVNLQGNEAKVQEKIALLNKNYPECVSSTSYSMKNVDALRAVLTRTDAENLAKLIDSKAAEKDINLEGGDRAKELGLTSHEMLFDAWKNPYEVKKVTLYRITSRGPDQRESADDIVVNSKPIPSRNPKQDNNGQREESVSSAIQLNLCSKVIDEKKRLTCYDSIKIKSTRFESGGKEELSLSLNTLDPNNRALSYLLTQARAVPYFQGGMAIGLRLFAIRRESLFDQLGFKNGDILRSIDGQSLGDLPQFVRVLLQSEPPIKTLSIIRNNEEKTLIIKVTK